MAIKERRKSAFYVVILCAVLIALVLAAGNEQGNFHSVKVKSPNDLSEFLSSLGWECEINTLTEQSTVLPEQFDDTFIAYNAIQLKQSCDLTRYAGKKVTVYTVKILNYSDTTETVYATVMVYRGRVIGGDIHAAAMDGFMLPLK